MSLKLYADGSRRRALQQLGDLLLVLWVVGWVRLGDLVHDRTLGLATPGRSLDSAGSGLADQLRNAGDQAANVPLVGDALRAPLDGAGDAADRIAAAGVAQVHAVEGLAFWLGLCIAAIPVLVLCAVYLPARWRFVREATAGQKFMDSAADLDLFALRALSNQPLYRLARISDDPAEAWRRKDSEVIRRLARLELADAGLRVDG